MEENEKIEVPKKKRIVLKILILLFLIFFLIYLYARFIEPRLLLVHEYATVDSLIPSSFDGLKIAHYSDLLYDQSKDIHYIKNVVQKLNHLHADVVIFTGDLFSDKIEINQEIKNSLKEELKKIEARFRKYAVLGNLDYINKEAFKEIMEDAGFIVLDNSFDLLYYQDSSPLMVIGTSSYLEKESDIKKAITSEDDISKYFKIWLSHEPILFNELALEEITPNYLFTGHTLGGLISLPSNKYLLNQSGCNDYMDSFYEKNTMKMFVSNGIGTYKYPLRFMNPPSISLYRIYKD